MYSKPDCTGQRFGLLTVLGRGDVVKVPCKTRGNKSYRAWVLQCDCGTTIQLKRGDFDRSTSRGQKSCGCLRLNHKGRRPKDITGDRFGNLVAINLTGKKIAGKPAWLLQCDCGNTREMSLSQLGRGYRLNCGSIAHQPGLRYPPAPNPYPKEAGEIVAKYLRLTQTSAPKIDTRIQDERIERLLRAAWIITYRRQRGETFSDQHESRFIHKHLRYSISAVKLRRLVEAGGYSCYTFSGYKQIGDPMTNVTSENYPALEMQGTNRLSTKRLKFKRH